MSETVCVAMPASSGGSSSSRGRPTEAPVPIPGPPPRSDVPRAELMERPAELVSLQEPLQLKEVSAPRFGVGFDEVLSTVEPSKEDADKALDSEVEELNPWTPSARDKLQEEARSLTL